MISITICLLFVRKLWQITHAQVEMVEHKLPRLESNTDSVSMLSGFFILSLCTHKKYLLFEFIVLNLFKWLVKMIHLLDFSN